MRNKRILILGGKRGLSGATSDILKISNEVVHVSRHTGDFCGDLRDQKFRDTVVGKFDPQIVISCFGDWADATSLVSSLNCFFYPNVDLFEQFSKKKSDFENFVLVSSTAAQFSTSPGYIKENFNYTVSKRLVSDLFRQVQLWGRYKSKVTLFEPGFIDTDFANIRKRYANLEAGSLMAKADINPLPAVEVAKILCSIIDISQTQDMHCSIFNHTGAKIRTYE